MAAITAHTQQLLSAVDFEGLSRCRDVQLRRLPGVLLLVSVTVHASRHLASAGLAITGPFNFDAAVALLPTSVKHLKLCPDAETLPDVVDLTDFCRFKALETLTIYVHADDGDVQPGNSFVLSTVLAQLVTLTLSNWPFVLRSGCSLAACLPNLAHAALHLPVHLLQSLVDIKSIRALSLILLEPDPVLLAGPNGITVTIKSSSQLSTLELCGPIQTKIRLIMHKCDVMLSCTRLTLQDILIEPSNSYLVPKHFNQLDWYW